MGKYLLQGKLLIETTFVCIDLVSLLKSFHRIWFVLYAGNGFSLFRSAAVSFYIVYILEERV